MLFERVGDVLVLVHGAQNPRDSEWNAYVEYARAAVHGGQPLTALLVTTLGGSPNASQRKAILAAGGDKLVPTCVCTDSRVARGVITAIRWVASVPMHALPLTDIEMALQLLDVPAQQHAAVRSVLQRLQSQLDTSRTG
jgi:hypothetical protein